MSKVSVPCPNCSALLNVPADVLGRKIKCPKCQEIVRLVTPTDVKSEPSPSPTAGSNSATAIPSHPSPSHPSPSPVAARPAGPTMAKPIVPMATVIAPETMPVIAKAQPKPASAPAVTTSAVKSAGDVTTEKAAAPNFSDLDAKVAADAKPRIKIKRKQSNPWPIILLGVGALVVLGLIVTLLILFLPKDFGGGGGPIVPEIQFVNDSQTEVGKSVRIPIAVTYPSSFSAADKERWTFQVAPENPEGTAWDAATGFLTWSPGTRDAGKSHALAIIIQNSTTRETNRATFQVHVPALSPGIMSALAQLNQNQVVFTASIPKAHEAMKHQETIPSLVEFQIGNDRVDVYDYSSVEIATAKLAEIDDGKLEQLGLTASMTPPLRYEQRDGAIMIAPIAVIEGSPSIKNWFDPPPPQ